MGSNLAQELAGGVFDVPLEQQIAIQLRSNHYPPVPLAMVEPCVDAIYAVNEGESERLINLPSPIKWKGNDKAPAYAIVEAHHLDPWVTYEE